MQQTTDYSPLLHRTAQATVAATLCLIFLGGLVTSHGAGMSVPDWPNSYGYNMFTFPPSRWVGGIFYEHTHRLLATAVGFLAILCVVIAYLRESRAWVRRLSVAVLLAVIFQGVLGGLRVVLVNLDLAVVHACVAQAFLCLATLLAVVTSRFWLATRAPLADLIGGTRLVRAGAICAIAIYAQLVVGALMRHDQAGLAIPDFPLNYGHVLPPITASQLDAANHWREADVSLHGVSEIRVTLGQVWLHFAHRLGACVVAGCLLWLIASTLARPDAGAIKPHAVILFGLLLAQLTLGVLTVLWRKPADVASLHVVVGAMTLMTTFVLTIRASRLYVPRLAELPGGFAVGLAGAAVSPTT